MLSVTKKSKLKPEEVLKKAVTFFGDGGFGLKVMEEDENHVYLEGGGGGVNVIVSAEAKGTKVDMETTEWEIQARNFLSSLK
jgi:hypothetical protein